jgi:hypothetical protein
VSAGERYQYGHVLGGCPGRLSWVPAHLSKTHIIYLLHLPVTEWLVPRPLHPCSACPHPQSKPIQVNTLLVALPPFSSPLHVAALLPHAALTSPHLTSPHLASPHLASPHFTSLHLTSPHLTSTNPDPSYARPSDALCAHRQQAPWPAVAQSQDSDTALCRIRGRGTPLLRHTPTHT